MKKFEFPSDLDFRYLIQSPAGKHKRFRVLKVWNNPKPGEPARPSVVDPSLDAVNAAMLNGKLSKESARKEVELLVERLYREVGVKKFKVVSNNDNKKALDQFWEDYCEDRRLSDPESAFAKYRRAIEAIGELSIRTASKRELQQAIDGKYSGNKQREIVGRLHTLLDWLKRSDVRLTLEDEEVEEVKYLTEDELETVLMFIEDETFKLACRAARGTGARIGELLALKTTNIQNNGKSLFIKYQLKRNGTIALAKSKKADFPGRKTFVFENARSLLSRWIKEKIKFTPEIRRNAANIIRLASQKAFPDSPEKWIKFHDLRHSYAVELAQSGVDIKQIAEQLGNSVRVCERHYTGFVSTDMAFEIIEAKLKAAKEILEKSKKTG